MDHRRAVLQQSSTKRGILQQPGLDANAGGAQLFESFELRSCLGAPCSQHIDAELCACNARREPMKPVAPVTRSRSGGSDGEMSCE